MSETISEISLLMRIRNCLLSIPPRTQSEDPMLPSGTTLELLISLKRVELRAIGRRVDGCSKFSMSTPVALIKGMDVTEVTIGSLATELNCSSALASPEIVRFMELASTEGNEKAFALCSDDDGVGGFGERFCEMWDEASKDLKEGAAISTNDLVELTTLTRDGIAATPKQMLVVWKRKTESEEQPDEVSYCSVQINSL